MESGLSVASAVTVCPRSTHLRTNYVSINLPTSVSFAIDQPTYLLCTMCQSIYIPAVYRALPAVYSAIVLIVKSWTWEKIFFGMAPMNSLPCSVCYEGINTTYGRVYGLLYLRIGAMRLIPGVTHPMQGSPHKLCQTITRS